MNKFTGMKVLIYRMPDGSCFGIADEIYKGNVEDAEIYDLGSMTTSEITELLKCGGVYVNTESSWATYKHIKKEGEAILMTTIVDDCLEDMCYSQKNIKESWLKEAIQNLNR